MLRLKILNHNLGVMNIFLIRFDYFSLHLISSFFWQVDSVDEVNVNYSMFTFTQPFNLFKANYLLFHYNEGEKQKRIENEPIDIHDILCILLSLSRCICYVCLCSGQLNHQTLAKDLEEEKKKKMNKVTNSNFNLLTVHELYVYKLIIKV